MLSKKQYSVRVKDIWMDDVFDHGIWYWIFQDTTIGNGKVHGGSPERNLALHKGELDGSGVICQQGRWKAVSPQKLTPTPSGYLK